MTNEYRRQVYERFLHRVALYVDVYDGKKISEAISLIHIALVMVKYQIMNNKNVLIMLLIKWMNLQFIR